MKKIILFVFILLSACNPFKVTDPSDPKFDINEFKFQDYKTEQELQSALQKAFPAGTDRSMVESILMDKAHLFAAYYKNNENYYVTYYTHKDMPSHGKILYGQIEYDSKDDVIGFRTQFLGGKDSPRFGLGDEIQKGQKLN